MRRQRLLPVAVAAVGFVVVAVGVRQGLVHVAPGYEGTIVTGWGRDLNHEERLLVRVAAVGVVGAAAALRWRRFAVVPVAAGGVVAFYALRAAGHYAMDPGLYTEVETPTIGPVRFVLGAEPFLLVAGAVLLVVAGVRGWRAESRDADDPSPRSSPT